LELANNLHNFRILYDFKMFYVPRLFLDGNTRSALLMLFYFAVANYIWAILTLIVFFLGEKFPVAHPLNLKNLGLHFLFSLAIAAVFTPIYVLFVNFYNYGVLSLTIYPLAGSFIINTVTNSFMYYAGSLAAHQAVFYSQKFREREFQLQQAELQILKMQIHPHFFFNTLNAISALMYSAPKEADKMIIQLGNMFRSALKKDKAQEIPLEEELEFLRAFLQIHQILMEERLSIEWDIAPDTLRALVPNLILQPLAENAIQHGIAPLEEGGRIAFSAARKNGKLLLQIRDTGAGFVPAKNCNNGGIGLSNTKGRLENLYGDTHKFSIAEQAGEGVTIKIELPFRSQPEDNNEN
jgi:two-component system, LytTR family, sensor kinase